MRGTQKRVVYLKNTGSDMFDEAYFIIKENGRGILSVPGEDDLIREANRIINEHVGRRKSDKGRIKREIGAFIIGVLISFILTVLIFK